MGKSSVELTRMATETDMHSCQSTCFDTISLRELENLPILNSELETLPKLIRKEQNHLAAEEAKDQKL